MPKKFSTCLAVGPTKHGKGTKIFALADDHNLPRAPFLAPVKEASIKASASSSCPRACTSLARTRKILFSLPSRTHCWKRRWQVWPLCPFAW